MKTRTSLIALGITVLLGAPLASYADITWITTADEPGSRIVITRDDRAAPRVAHATAKAPMPGDISADREYVFAGEEGGWHPRQMEYRYDGGRLVHVDDPVGHMERSADTRPLTTDQRIALERSSGS